MEKCAIHRLGLLDEFGKFRDGLQCLVASTKNLKPIFPRKLVVLLGKKECKYTVDELLITHLGGVPGPHKVK